jgi:predicted RNA-binding protein (TIGR00451 family)
MEELRRTRVGDFLEKDCISLIRLKDAVELSKKKPELLAEIIKPLDYAVKGWPKVYVRAGAAENIAKGADLMAPGLEKVEGTFEKKAVLVIMNGDKPIAVGKALFDSATITNQKRGPVVNLEKVLV